MRDFHDWHTAVNREMRLVGLDPEEATTGELREGFAKGETPAQFAEAIKALCDEAAKDTMAGESFITESGSGYSATGNSEGI